ncbi:MAG: sigma-70 family RNA polymerase sigma factor, partial [Bacteroidaceae bacterium]|nr:sigma-70 family RNA polymerase sigma factor [Bacteroidaceae bacterium]
IRMKRDRSDSMNSQGSLSVSDESIARLLCDDNHVEEAVRLIMKKYGEPLYWHIRRMVVAHDDAEDALQETMINVYKYRSTYSNEFPLSSWLYKIATNESLKLLKNRAGYSMSVDDLGDSLKDSVRAEASPDADETLILLQEAIAMLPTKQKMVFNLRYYEDKSYEEIHQIVGDSVNTLKTNYHYAVQKIKEYITEHEL